MKKHVTLARNLTLGCRPLPAPLLRGTLATYRPWPPAYPAYTVAAVFLPVRVLVPVPVGVAPARPVRSTGTIPVHLLPSALLSYPVQVQRSLRVQMAQRGHLHIQVSTFSSRSDGLAVVQLSRPAVMASRRAVINRPRG